jgi:hypothetical protein
MLITREQNNTPLEIIELTDLSPSPSAYNEFDIDVEFPADGDYRYQVYQDEEMTHLLEIGKIRVIDENEVVNEVYDVQIENKVYEH